MTVLLEAADDLPASLTDIAPCRAIQMVARVRAAPAPAARRIRVYGCAAPWMQYGEDDWQVSRRRVDTSRRALREWGEHEY